jgi:hypothetical protein
MANQLTQEFMMKKVLRSMVLAFVMVFAAGSASAVVINFDFQAWSGATPPSVTYSGQGVLSDPGNNYWNSGGSGWATYSTTNMKASDGVTVTTVGFAVTICKNLNWITGALNALTGDYKYIDAGYNPATITFSGLAVNTPYRFYLYAAGNAANKGSKFTCNGVTKETTGATTALVSNNFIENDNYVILDAVSDATGKVIITWSLRTGASEAALNGFQITDQLIVTPSSDLSGNGKVDMEDFGILSLDWQDVYEMEDLLKIAEDWMLITNVAFLSDPIVEMDAEDGIAYNSTLSDDLVHFDASQIAFSKIDGPGWLTVAADGTLSGTPANSNVGINAFTVRAQNLDGQSDQAALSINVNGILPPPPPTVEVVPAPYTKGLRNPLMGFTINSGGTNHPWATLTHTYIKWNEIENYESDTIDKIRTVCNSKWNNVQTKNIKVIPRVYLTWSGDNNWPADMTANDYSSEQFKTRLLRLVQRLGECWNNDPRVAFVEMGIFGKWGEQEQPAANAELDTLAANAFAAAFPNKLVSVRRNWQMFQSQPFGEYWDSWAHYDQMWGHGNEIAKLNAQKGRHLTNYVGGEVAYGWGNSGIQPGNDPTDSVSDPVHYNFVINSIRWLHCTQLRWIAGYDTNNPGTQAGADLIQQAFGYRFVLEKVAFSPSVTDGNLRVVLHVKNEGSAKFYYNWPVEVSLLNMSNRSVVWKQTFANTDIRLLLPGEGWTAPEWSNNKPNINWISNGTPGWTTPPQTYTATGDFQVSVPAGQYILALAVLDPAGNLPSLRFATSQYFNGGRHPIGIVAVNQSGGGALPGNMVFDDPAADNSLHYVWP